MSLQLCWIRNDLRVHDNLALAQAQKNGPAVALYIASPLQWDVHDEASVKRDFWRRNLIMLQAELTRKHIPLLIFRTELWSDIPRLFSELISKWDISGVHFNREYAFNEIHRDQAVTELCRERDVDVFAWHDQVLISPETLLNQSGKAFKVFTPYARKARSVIRLPDTPFLHQDNNSVTVKAADLPRVDKQCELDQAGWPEPDAHWEKLWPAGEAHAAERLLRFCRDHIGQYHFHRDQPALDATSCLSPYLAAGVLSIRECWRQSGLYGEGEGVDTWRNELLWRDFYRYVMYHFPHVCMNKPWKHQTEEIPWRHDKEEFDQWCAGKTGIPIIDAAMRQLLACGWMHNRLRMIVAMFLSKHLLIDWRWGESWFMRHLIDGDFASNNGGWQWSASTGTDAVPYFRIFNPVTQSRRFDSEGDFIRRYVPELIEMDSKSIHDPGLLRPASYSAPMIDLKFGRERALSAFKK